jgi:dimethylglycine dehydrogenase
MLNANGKLIGDFHRRPRRRPGSCSAGDRRAVSPALARRLPSAGVVAALRNEMLWRSPGRNRASCLARGRLRLLGGRFLSALRRRGGDKAVRIGCISFTGGSVEIWMPSGAQRAVYDAILTAGADLGLRHFGGHALNALRLEKGFGTWAREYRPIYAATEAGLDRFVDWGKSDAIGVAAAAKARDGGSPRRLVTFVVDAAEADAIGDEPVWHDGKVVGWITSGGYGHCVGKSIALGYVPAALAGATDGFEIEILGERRRATRVAQALYDPEGLRMRKG